MEMTELYSSKAIALVHNENASNKIAYLGEGLFPPAKKTGLDLKWIKSSNGLPVSLQPSAFDTKSTIRSREAIDVENTQMAFFKESMLVTEQDEQEVMRLEDADDVFAKEVKDRLYNDAETLIDGALVVPERMRMSLLANDNGHPSISINGDGATYEYNYDADGKYAQENFLSLSGQDMWSDTANSDPLADVEKGIDAVEDKTGNTPEYMIISKKTLGYLKNNDKIKSYILAQNPTANVYIDEAKVKQLFLDTCGITILVYKKKYKDGGVTKKFYPDGMATLIPSGALGKTWFGMTPDERTGVKDTSKDVSIVNTGVAVSVKITDDPVNTKTTASEIVLPSFEQMDSTFMIKAYAVAY